MKLEMLCSSAEIHLYSKTRKKLRDSHIEIRKQGKKTTRFIT